jgi:hypothetical protein
MTAKVNAIISPKIYMLKPERNANPDFSNVPVKVRTATKNPANMKTSPITKTETLLPSLSNLTNSFNDTLFPRRLKVFHPFLIYNNKHKPWFFHWTSTAS